MARGLVLCSQTRTIAKLSFSLSSLASAVTSVMLDLEMYLPRVSFAIAPAPKSNDEATLVGNRVSEMGIRCEIARCDWMNGKPKQGHLQEAARDMRLYKIFQDVCMQNQISVLLVAHHADDQAELFILRSSRDSGVLGLAGMAFTSQVFSSHTNLYNRIG
ncbi:hypothetical protein GQ457_HM001190 [Hibiscus cannabinus]